MNDRVHLMGVEGVESAGRNMVRAAQEIAAAANSMAHSAQLMQQAQKDMDYTLSNHQRFLNDWLARLQLALEEGLSFEEPVQVQIVKDEEEETTRSESPTLPAPQPIEEGELEFIEKAADDVDFEGPMD